MEGRDEEGQDEEEHGQEGQDQEGQDQEGQDEQVQNEEGENQERQNEGTQDEEEQDKEGRDEEGRDEEGRDEGGQDEDAQDEEEQDEEGQDKEGQNEDGQYEDGHSAGSPWFVLSQPLHNSSGVWFPPPFCLTPALFFHQSIDSCDCTSQHSHTQTHKHTHTQTHTNTHVFDCLGCVLSSSFHMLCIHTDLISLSIHCFCSSHGRGFPLNSLILFLLGCALRATFSSCLQVFARCCCFCSWQYWCLAANLVEGHMEQNNA